ncbi:glycosyltransferase family 2 protein [bacterium]|nr:glycosyltransferase family 2 protein [bacterium]
MSSSSKFSICIPTFNRLEYLQKLVQQIIGFVENDQLNLEICISDNCSTDGTWEYLQGIADKHFQFKVYRQENNIGANRNLVFATSLATSEWMMAIGDDDCFVLDGLNDLLYALPELQDYDYILLNSLNHDGAHSIDLPHGHHSMTSVTSSLKGSIWGYGFCGIHVFRQSIALHMRSRDLEEFRPWPSFGAFTSHLSCKDFFFFAKPAVLQDGNGEALSFQPHDWLHLVIRQLVVLQINIQSGNDKLRAVSNDIVHSNLWSLRFLKTFFKSLLYMPDSTKNILDAQEYKHLNLLTGSLSIKLHSITYKCLSSIPISFYFLLVKLFAKKDVNSYKFTKEIDEKDGVNSMLDIYEDVTHDK